MRTSAQVTKPGLAVDAHGGPVVDPTANVIALNEAANRRQDDLREAAEKYNTMIVNHVREMSSLRATHQRELDHAESERLDSIRQVDREDVNKTAAQALNAIQTLAAVTSGTAETLRTQVATTAAAAANQLVTITAEINKRLSALELASSEGKGKQALSDPMMEKLVQRMDTLLEKNTTVSGRSAGGAAMWGYVAAGFGFLLTLMSIASLGFVLFSRMPK